MRQNEEEMDEDYDPTTKDGGDGTNRLANQQQDDDVFGGEEYEDDSEMEDDEVEKHVERQFNFVGEISVLVDYAVISKYALILTDKEHSKKTTLIQAVSTFFKRVVNQIKASWIFFQLEYMAIFQNVLNEGHSNNPLMIGIGEFKSKSFAERQTAAVKEDLKQIVTVIVRHFIEKLSVNRLLGVEALFRFQTRQQKDDIMDNYESSLGTRTLEGDDEQGRTNKDKPEVEEAIWMDHEDYFQSLQKDDGANNRDEQPA